MSVDIFIDWLHEVEQIFLLWWDYRLDKGEAYHHQIEESSIRLVKAIEVDKKWSNYKRDDVTVWYYINEWYNLKSTIVKILTNVEPCIDSKIMCCFQEFSQGQKISRDNIGEIRNSFSLFSCLEVWTNLFYMVGMYPSSSRKKIGRGNRVSLANFERARCFISFVDFPSSNVK